MKADLHIHSTASDGTWSPEALIQNILSAEIQVFSITDHDSLDNVDIISRLAKNGGLFFIPGVEISVSYCKMSYHILGYGIDIESDELQKTLTENKGSSEEKDIKSLIFLKNRGYPVSLKEFEEYTYLPERGGWKALNYFIDKGFCQNYKDFFQLFKDMGNPFNNTSYVSPEMAISSIVKSGGIPILAHPGATFYGDDYQAIVGSMFEKGIKGIECFHPENNEEITEYCINFCTKNNLYITGGSDCHGDFVEARSLGKPEIFENQIKIGSLSDRYIL